MSVYRNRRKIVAQVYFHSQHKAVDEVPKRAQSNCNFSYYLAQIIIHMNSVIELEISSNNFVNALIIY